MQLELKYCERCGGLWIRALGSPHICCASCAIEMAQVAIPRRRNIKAAIHSTGSEQGSLQKTHALVLIGSEARTA